MAELLAFADPLILRHLIDSLSGHFTSSTLVALCALLLVSSGWRAYAQNAAAYLSTRIDLELITHLRSLGINHLTTLDYRYHVATANGENVYIFDCCIPEIVRLGADALCTIATVIFVFCCAFVLLFNLDAHLTIALLPLVFMAPLVTYLYRRTIKKTMSRVDTVRRRSLKVCEEQVQQAFQIQLLGAQQLQERLVKKSWNRLMYSTLKGHKLELEHQFVARLLGSVAVLTIFAYGIIQVDLRVLTIGTLIAFYGCAFRMFDPILRLVAIHSNLARVSVQLRHLRTFFDTRSGLSEPKGDCASATSVLDGQYELCAEDVSYAFVEKRAPLVVNRAAFPPRSYTAIIGSSGVGKTTFARLLARLDDPDSGAVTYGGVALSEMALSRVRQRICYMSQQAVLFNISIAANVRMGNCSTTEKDYERALHCVGLDNRDDIGRSAGQNGSCLSGGERQRVALARMLARKPAVLIMDEGGNALDAETEQGIFKRMRQLYPDLTVIAITHRRQTLSWADRVYAVHDSTVSLLRDGAQSPVKNIPGLDSLSAAMPRDGHLESTWTVASELA